jgi:hypothetical protein
MTGPARKKPHLPGMPRDIALLRTPQGWRHSLTTVDGALVCGRLTDVPADADPAVARAAATAVLTALCQDFHGTAIDVTWEPPGSLTARITPRPAGA